MISTDDSGRPSKTNAVSKLDPFVVDRLANPLGDEVPEIERKIPAIVSPISHVFKLVVINGLVGFLGVFEQCPPVHVVIGTVIRQLILPVAVFLIVAIEDREIADLLARDLKVLQSSTSGHVRDECIDVPGIVGE